MRPDEERALYGLADDDDRPDPANAQTAAEFVALLDDLVEWSGLSLPEIEEVARSKGYVLPEAIIVTALSHDALPPEELVVALVRSIGINDREVKYWAEALWRLESRPAYDPGQEPNQEYERKAPPYDIGQIYPAKDEPEPAEPYVVPAAFEAGQLHLPEIDPYLDPPGVAGSAAMGEQPYVVPAPYELGSIPEVDEPYAVPAPYEVGQVPDAGEAYEEPYAAPMHYEVGQVPGADGPYEGPQPYGVGQGPAVGEDYEAEPHPGEPPHGFATEYETVEHDERYADGELDSPAASRGFAEGSLAHAVHERRNRSSWTGMHRRASRDDDDEDDDAGQLDDVQPTRRYEARDNRAAWREAPRIRDLATRSMSRVNQKAKWPLPVAVALSVVLAISFVAWMVIAGSGGVPDNDVAGGPPGNVQNPRIPRSGAPGGSADPTASDGTLPSGGPGVDPANNPNAQSTTQGPLSNPQATTQGPLPNTTPPRTYNTALSGAGSTSCTPEGGQWRLKISVTVTVSDPPPNVSPQGQAGPSGSMQGFSLSGGGASFSGSTTVTMGPTPAPDVGTVQWVVTMTLPGGRVVRDESHEGYSCA